MKEIPLTQGLVALVDDTDYDDLMQFPWCAAQASPGLFYARNSRLGYMHRYLMKPPKGKVVDHIDGNPLNNQRHNLRVCNQHQNIANRKGMDKRNTTGYAGVYWYPRYGKWIAQIGHKGKVYTIGYFDEIEDAARARDKRAKKLHQQFARLNFPDEHDSSV